MAATVFIVANKICSVLPLKRLLSCQGRFFVCVYIYVTPLTHCEVDVVDQLFSIHNIALSNSPKVHEFHFGHECDLSLEMS